MMFDVLAPMAAQTPAETAWALLQRLVLARHHHAPRRLQAPGPSESQLRALVALAARVPDHGRLQPWRYHWIDAPERAALADVFEAALREHETAPTAEALRRAREKALSAPVLLIAVACLSAAAGPAAAPRVDALGINAGDGVCDAERWITLGASLQNLLLGAQALGFDSGVTSGRVLHSQSLRAYLALADDEWPACFVSLGRAAPERATLDTRADVLTEAPNFVVHRQPARRGAPK